MFDIGFSELLVIAVVALIVIGPERLPKVARTMGHLFGRMQRYVNDVKADISREMELDELRKLQANVQSAARSFEDSFSKEIKETEAQLQSVVDAVPAAVTPQEPAGASAGAPVPASGQLELGLDAPAPARVEKQG
jgi:sec-independent protein translocase protein TatB